MKRILVIACAIASLVSLTGVASIEAPEGDDHSVQPFHLAGRFKR